MSSTKKTTLMHTTKLVFLGMIGLAMIDFSIAPSLNAAARNKAPKQARCSIKLAPLLVSSTAKSAPLKGLAAVYSNKLNGRKTASGQRLCQDQLTAAHKSLPLGTKVRVTNLRNNTSVEVRINDRGPRHAGRVIDLTTAAAKKIGMLRAGIALVTLEIIDGSSMNNT